MTLFQDFEDLCEGGEAVITAVIGGGTGTTLLQWQYRDSASAWADIPGEETAILNTGALTLGKYVSSVF